MMPIIWREFLLHPKSQRRSLEIFTQEYLSPSLYLWRHSSTHSKQVLPSGTGYTVQASALWVWYTSGTVELWMNDMILPAFGDTIQSNNCAKLLNSLLFVIHT